MKKFQKKQLVKIREKQKPKKRMRKFRKRLNLKKAKVLKTKVQEKATKVRKIKETNLHLH